MPATIALYLGVCVFYTSFASMCVVISAPLLEASFSTDDALTFLSLEDCPCTTTSTAVATAAAAW